MADKPKHNTRETRSPPKVDKDERFSLHPLATDEALRALLRSEADREAEDDEEQTD